MVFSGYMPSSGIAGSYGNSIFSFLRNPPYCSPQWLYQFTFPPTVQEGSLFSTPSPAFVLCRFSYDAHSTICIPFISFSSLIAVAKTSKTMLNNSGESGQPCLFLDLSGNGFNFSPLRTILDVGMSYMTFTMLR